MAVSLSHVSNILMSLLVCGYEEKLDMQEETLKIVQKENTLQRSKLLELTLDRKSKSGSNSPGLRPEKPKSTFWEGAFKMTFTTISPKNQYKKLATLAKGRPLTQGTCHWLRSFNNAKKHKLLNCKAVLNINLQPAFHDKRRHEELVRLNLTLYKLQHYIEKLKAPIKPLDR